LDEGGSLTVDVGGAHGQARLDAGVRLSLSGKGEKLSLVACVCLDEEGSSSNSRLGAIGVGRSSCRRGGRSGHGAVETLSSGRAEQSHQGDGVSGSHC
jgi:hypothetical protein